MATQNTTIVSPNLTFGFLAWWTIRQGIYDVQTLHNVGDEEKLPAAVKSLIVGAEPKSAWLKATQLGVKGSTSVTHDPTLRARFLTRDVGDGLRAVIREEIDQDEKAVSTQQLALLGFDADDNTIAATIQNFAPPGSAIGLGNELVTLIESMAEDMEGRIGHVDDTKVRSALLRWLEIKHRVCVRGTGGVYYIPLTPTSFEAVRDEVVAVRSWIKECNLGSFSVVQLTKDGATSIDDIQESAVAEILNELASVNESLDQYENSTGMNSGSRMYSASTQVEKVDALKAKAKHLEEALGDIILKVQVQLDMTAKRAVQMRMSAAALVQNERTVKEKAKSQRGKKSGAALDRQRVKAV